MHYTIVLGIGFPFARRRFASAPLRRGFPGAGQPGSAPVRVVAVLRVTAAFESVLVHVGPDRTGPRPSLAIL